MKIKKKNEQISIGPNDNLPEDFVVMLYILAFSMYTQMLHWLVSNRL